MHSKVENTLRRRGYFMRNKLLGIVLSVFSTWGIGLHATLFDPPPIHKVEVPVSPDPIPIVVPPVVVPPDPIVEIGIPSLIKPISPREQFYSQLQTSVQNNGSPFPLANWLSATQLPSFYQTTFRSLLSQEKYFTSIESLDQYHFGVTPYGFDSHFTWREENFRLQTLGITGTGNRTFNSWTLGGGAGYFHSSLQWEKKNQIDSFFFGPQATYQFGKGYMQWMLAGIYNMYDRDSASAGGQKAMSGSRGWDVFTRIEGGVHWEVPFFNQGTCFVQPTANLSYLGALENSYQDRGPDGLTVPVKIGYSDFVSSRLAIQF